MLTIGRINYINNLPLFSPLLSGKFEHNHKIVLGMPDEMNRQLNSGALDLALVSSIEFLRNQHKYLLFPDLGVGAREKVMSIILFIKEEVESLDQKKVGLTVESASSVQLIKILCKNFWQVCPEYLEMADLNRYATYDGFLLIGDKALEYPQFPGYRAIDVVSEWHRETGLGMAFGVFAVRKEVYANQREEVDGFFTQLRKARNWSINHIEDVIDHAKKHCRLSAQTIREYFEVLKYDLQAPEIDGLKAYAKYSQIDYSPYTIS